MANAIPQLLLHLRLLELPQKSWLHVRKGLLSGLLQQILQKRGSLPWFLRIQVLNRSLRLEHLLLTPAIHYLFLLALLALDFELVEKSVPISLGLIKLVADKSNVLLDSPFYLTTAGLHSIA